jgi:CarD-like/TRCF domain
VSQKTRKKSASKSSKKAAAVARSATKGRAKTSVKEVRKVAATKSSKNKRSLMPDKTAKTAAKATGSKTVASKVAAKISLNKTSLNKTSPSKATAPKAAPAPKAAVKPAAKPAAAAPRVEEPKKVVTQRQGFKANEFVVYPAHGVGQILAIEEQEIAGAKLELFVINFMKDKMTLRVPTAKVANVGMRKLSEPSLVKKALETLKGRARVKRTMWSRRAPKWCAISIARNRSPSSPTANASSMKRRSIACRAKSRLSSIRPRPKRSRKSKASSPRARAAAPRPKPVLKPTVKAMLTPTISTQTVTTRPSRTKPRKHLSRFAMKSPVERPGFFVWATCPPNYE